MSAASFTAWKRRLGGPVALRPVIPPGAPLSPHSRIPCDQGNDQRGKVPGMRGPDGWHSGPWREWAGDDAALARWEAMGAGVGVVADDWPGWDVDVEDGGLAVAIRAEIEGVLGRMLPRVGRAPRLLLPCRASGRVASRLMAWEGADGKPQAVDLRAAGRFYVLDGLHPRGVPYGWPDGRPDAPEDFPALDQAAADCAFAAVAALLESVGIRARETGGTSASERGTMDQAALVAPEGIDLRAAVLAMPTAASRDEWIARGCAIKAAGGDFEAWFAWSRKWGPEDEGDLRRRWEGFRPPFVVGWPQVERSARDGGWTGSAEMDFAGVAPAAVDAVPASASPAQLGTMRLERFTASECRALPMRPYVWKGVLASGDLGILFGPPGSGKSVLAPLAAHAVATGGELFGRRTRRQGVAYLAAEASESLKLRVAALAQDRACWPDALWVVPFSGNLLHDVACGAVADMLRETGAGLLVVDTFAAAFPGLRENDADDMGRAVARLRRLQAETGVALLVVHHGTKAGGAGPRGHSLLNGAADVTLEVLPPEEGATVRAVVFGKNRNGASGDVLRFDVAPVALGHDEDGDERTEPVGREAGTGARTVRLTAAQRDALGLLQRLAGEAGTVLPPGPGSPGPWPVVALDDWRTACLGVDGICGASANRASRRQAFNRIRDRLEGAGLVLVRGEWAGAL